MNKISNRTLNNLSGVDSKLVILCGYVLCRGKVDFTVYEGLRSAEKQNEYYNNGSSQLDGYNKISKHQLGKAIDFFPYPFNGWDDIKSFKEVAEEFKICAEFLGIKIVYGGDWNNFKDYPHIELV